MILNDKIVTEYATDCICIVIDVDALWVDEETEIVSNGSWWALVFEKVMS